MRPVPQRLLLALVCALVAAPAACLGDDGDWDGGQDESAPRDADNRNQEWARQASARGEILTIAEVFERARARYPGRVLGAELDREQGRWVYELKVLDPDGRLLEIYLDAQSGAVLGREGDD